MMKWLENKLSVPKVTEYEKKNGRAYTLMSRINGVMACDCYYLDRTDLLADLLAQSLRLLWSVNISDCRVRCTLDEKLIQARRNVEHGLMNADDCEPEAFGQNGFKYPKELILWHEQNCTREDLVLLHGDLCRLML